MYLAGGGVMGRFAWGLGRDHATLSQLMLGRMSMWEKRREMHGQEGLGRRDAAGRLAAKEEEVARGVVVADGGILERGCGGALDEVGDVEPLERRDRHGGGDGLGERGGEEEEGHEEEHRERSCRAQCAREDSVDDDDDAPHR
jgi:hypothetical protein